ncbi:MAG: c-type cytochrome [Chloroflexota bacterium]
MEGNGTRTQWYVIGMSLSIVVVILLVLMAIIFTYVLTVDDGAGEDDQAEDVAAVILDETAETEETAATEEPAAAEDVEETPTEAAPETEAEAADEAAADDSGLTAEEENIIFFISEFSDPDNGEQLFNATYEVEMVDGTIGEWACSTCHVVNSDDVGVGPGLASLPQRAGDRVPGQPAELYIYNSIVNPAAYIVDGYADGVMPVGYADIFSEQELYDLSAYMLSLGGE